MIIVMPLYVRREAHQNTFYSAVGFQTQQCAFVMDEIKLHIPPTADFLPISLRLGVRQIFSSFYNRDVCIQKTVAYFGDKVVPILHGLFIVCFQMVKKQAANTSCFLTMRVVKILIAFLFKIGIKLRRMLIAGFFAYFVETFSIFFKQVIGR